MPSTQNDREDFISDTEIQEEFGLLYDSGFNTGFRVFSQGLISLQSTFVIDRIYLPLVILLIYTEAYS